MLWRLPAACVARRLATGGVCARACVRACLCVCGRVSACLCACGRVSACLCVCGRVSQSEGRSLVPAASFVRASVCVCAWLCMRGSMSHVLAG